MPNSPFSLPYDTQSPSLSETVSYKTIDDIYDEIDRLIFEAKENDYPIGQSLYIQGPLFADIRQFSEKWHIDMINDYWAVKSLNLPLAPSLDSVSVHSLDSMMIIDQELNDIRKYKAKIEANKK